GRLLRHGFLSHGLLGQGLLGYRRLGDRLLRGSLSLRLGYGLFDRSLRNLLFNRGLLGLLLRSGLLRGRLALRLFLSLGRRSLLGHGVWGLLVLLFPRRPFLLVSHSVPPLPRARRAR